MDKNDGVFINEKENELEKKLSTAKQWVRDMLLQRESHGTYM